MRFFTADGNEWFVKWRYDGSTTYCTITSSGHIILYDHAECSIKDTFVKDIGRKISFTRTLRRADFSYEDRKAAWEAYFNRKRNQNGK